MVDKETGNWEPIRSFRIPDFLYEAAKARAESEQMPLSFVVRRLLEAWLANRKASIMADTAESGQLVMIANAPAPAKGAWEKLAAKRIRELTRSGYFTAASAGYADALRMAGRNLDHAERVGSTRDRIAATQAWEATLARIVPQPSESASASSDSGDPWQELGSVLRTAALRD